MRRPLHVVSDQPPFDPGIPAQDAAGVIGCDLSRVYKLLRQGKLKGYKDGRAVRVLSSSLRAYQTATPLGTAPEPAPAKRAPKASSRAHGAAVSALRGLGLRL